MSDSLKQYTNHLWNEFCKSETNDFKIQLLKENIPNVPQYMYLGQCISVISQCIWTMNCEDSINAMETDHNALSDQY